ncbi:MAG: flagellar basal body rod protein FlgB [Deltaproteobacteria bacterium]|nr:flagellar basal body rod protein FlgB [Deltaproteobacteria bacterium]
MQLFGTLTEGLGAALEIYQARHQVLAENIANSETPGYRARDLQFADQLTSALAPPAPGAKTPEGAKAPSEPLRVEPTIDRDAALKPDGNSVALDVQVGRLAENAFKIQALTQILSGRYASLKRVIEGGKG